MIRCPFLKTECADEFLNQLHVGVYEIDFSVLLFLNCIWGREDEYGCFIVLSDTFREAGFLLPTERGGFEGMIFVFFYHITLEKQHR